MIWAWSSWHDIKTLKHANVPFFYPVSCTNLKWNAIHPNFSIRGLLFMHLYTESRQNTPHSQNIWQKGNRALHSDGRPLQRWGPHTSSQPASWGLALQPWLLPPNTPHPSPRKKSSANLGGSLPLSSNHQPSISPLQTNISLQHSSLHHMALELGRCCPRLRDLSTSEVPTFQADGRFVGGISCGLSCQRGTITAAQQSLAVTGGYRARGVPPIIPLWLGGATLSWVLTGSPFIFGYNFLLNLVQRGKTHFIPVRE